MKNRVARIVGMLAVAVMVLFSTTGCFGTVVKTPSDFQAVHYTDGTYSKREFGGCVGPNERRRDGWGDVNYYLPAGDRTFEFTGINKGGDADPITIQTKDAQELTVTGVITFELTRDCETLRKFLEEKALSKNAYFTKGDSDEGSTKYVSEGWAEYLTRYMSTPVRNSMNSESLKRGWLELYSNAAVRNEFTKNVSSTEVLQNAIDTSVGKGVIKVKGLQLDPPQPNAELKKTVSDVEVTKKRAAGEAEKARADTTAQQQKNALAAAQYQKFKLCRSAGLSEGACVTLQLADQGDIKFYPAGTNLIVPADQ